MERAEAKHAEGLRSVVSVLLRELGDFSLHPQGRPCGRPPAAAVLRPGSDTTVTGGTGLTLPHRPAASTTGSLTEKEGKFPSPPLLRPGIRGPSTTGYVGRDQREDRQRLSDHPLEGLYFRFRRRTGADRRGVTIIKCQLSDPPSDTSSLEWTTQPRTLLICAIWFPDGSGALDRRVTQPCLPLVPSGRLTTSGRLPSLGQETVRNHRGSILSRPSLTSWRNRETASSPASLSARCLAL
jgi:hypothetical protein